ncbi:endonuclease domain-containing protein [Humibacter ginsenosidimutans]|uniref:DUF559 domain-containing protein n=1 Tax=Humibacter ginsenosidimutans TaxID=2599293 RepID=A0A5B8M2V4_9MICO|nr:DUF559 domain-containing protein [Humibacter ginsenosidimutans]QDZ15128.1 DUF559 domain-containing protein [Humibacter ginsenosidimutans]
MPSIASELSRRGGLATRSQLRVVGCSARSLRRFADDGNARSIRRSWLATPQAEPDAVRAVELGGILGGESALRSFGVWVSHNTGLCVATPPGASHLPTLGDDEYRVYPHDFAWPEGKRWRTDIVSALAQLAARVEPVHFIASVDSALNTNVMTAPQLADLFARLPRRFRRLRRLIEPRAESGLESIVRVAAMLEGWKVEVQVAVPRVGRVDLVINGWLVIETDGDQWHSSATQRAKDRRRDAGLVRRGMRCHRFGYAQVMGDLDGCIEIIRTLLAAGRP